MFDYINEKTGFNERKKFQSKKEVIEYFTMKNMEYMFGDDFELSQKDLDEMAELVIQKKWNLKNEDSKVFSVRVSRSNTKEEINQKLSDLKNKIEISFL